MQISNGIEIVDLALFLKKQKTLIIADIHIGFEEALNKQGLLIPRFQFKEVFSRLKKILDKTKPKLVIVNGDLKHEFGTISEQEWRDSLKILDLLRKYAKVILIKGNHDTILGPIARKRDVKVVDDYIIDDILVIHGHKLKKTDKKTIIIAHEHTAVSLKEGARVELFKCFLKGKYKRKTLIVQPSFNLVVEGTDVLKEKLLSPFLKQDLKNFEVFIVGDKIYRFGKLGYVR